MIRLIRRIESTNKKSQRIIEGAITLMLGLMLIVAVDQQYSNYVGAVVILFSGVRFFVASRTVVE